MEKIEHAMQTHVTPKPEDIEKEKTPEPPADYLDNDPRFKSIIEDASLDYLRSSDSDFFKKNYSGELTPEGYLKDASGKDSKLKPSQNIGGGWSTVEKMARDEFSERYRADNEVYKQREKSRVYETPAQDPAYKEVEASILEKVNNDSQIRNNGTARIPEPGMDLWNRVTVRENLRGWSHFVSTYPEKAAAYASKNEFLARELKSREQKNQEPEQNKNEQKMEVPTSSKEKVAEPEKAREKIAVPVEQDRFGGKAFVMENNEEVYKNPWQDDPELKSLQEKVKEETKKRASEGVGVHEDFAKWYGEIDKTVRGEHWKDFVDKYPAKAQAYQGYYKEIRDVLSPVAEQPIAVEVEKDEAPEMQKVETIAENIEPKKPAATEAPKNVEAGPTKEDVISDYLSYQDIPVSVDEKKSYLDWSLKSESADKYAEALQEVLTQTPKTQIESTAAHMVTEAKGILGKMGIEGSSFLGSKTWAMWDMAKQYYYTTHPEEADSKYVIANPLKSPNKIAEIVDRHVGWEAYRLKDKKFAENFAKHPLYEKLQEYLKKAPKKNGDLSSKDLADLGSIIRKISEEVKG